MGTRRHEGIETLLRRTYLLTYLLTLVLTRRHEGVETLLRRPRAEAHL